MKTRIILTVAATAVIGGLVAGVLLKNKPAANKPAPEKIATAAPPKIEPPVASPTETAPVAPEVKVSVAPEKPAAQPAAQKNNGQNPAPPKEPVRDPAAREALGLVGVDPNAEAYWTSAIFDTSLPDAEREDLMEDLNEDGLSDPKHPGPEDLPVILNRLAIIEQLAPQADDFMLEHLGEAYKDLNNLLAGKPVQ